MLICVSIHVCLVVYSCIRLCSIFSDAHTGISIPMRVWRPFLGLMDARHPAQDPKAAQEEFPRDSRGTGPRRGGALGHCRSRFERKHVHTQGYSYSYSYRYRYRYKERCNYRYRSRSSLLESSTTCAPRPGTKQGPNKH